MNRNKPTNHPSGDHDHKPSQIDTSQEDVASSSKEGYVIGKGGSRLVIKSKQASDAASVQPQEVTLEPPKRRKAPDRKEPAVVEEKKTSTVWVTRLEADHNPGKERIKVDQAKFEKRTAKQDEGEIQEEQWEKSFFSGWWLLFGGLGIIALIVLGILIQSSFDEKLLDDESNKFDLGEGGSIEDSPKKWFQERAHILDAELMKSIQGYMGADSNEEKSKWVRNPEIFLKRAPDWSSEFRPSVVSLKNNSLSISHTDETGYAILSTLNQDFMPTRVYFTHEKNRLLIDWEASVAWSEVPMGVMQQSLRKQYENSDKKKVGDEPLYQEPVLVRCYLGRKQEHYSGSYNDQEHAVYMLKSPDYKTSFWAYVKRDSELNTKLKKMLGHGRYVMRLKADIPVTLRVARSKHDALPSQLDIVELVFKDWVAP